MRKTPPHPGLRIATAFTFIFFAGSIAVPLLHAIPSTFNNGIGVPFINPASMRLEDFANREDMWKQDAKLKGDWEMWNDPEIDDSTIELIHLKNSALVFGMPATEVTLQRRDNRPLRLVVVFSTADEKKPGNTQAQLTANINAWSGKSMELDSGSASLAYEQLSVQLTKAADSIRITLEPKDADES